MTILTFDVMLKKQSGQAWTTDALALPKARLESVQSADGDAVEFDRQADKIIMSKPGSGKLVGTIELPEDLVAASLIEKTKLDFEREKLAGEERAGRRTLWISLTTAIVSALATVAVAFIAQSGSSKPSSQPSVSQAFKDLVECRESLNRLATLAHLDQQTLTNLQEAVGRSVADCSDRLDRAIGAAQR